MYVLTREYEKIDQHCYFNESDDSDDSDSDCSENSDSEDSTLDEMYKQIDKNKFDSFMASYNICDDPSIWKFKSKIQNLVCNVYWFDVRGENF